MSFFCASRMMLMIFSVLTIGHTGMVLVQNFTIKTLYFPTSHNPDRLVLNPELSLFAQTSSQVEL